jgi:Domain of Unknown Function (DUF1080)
MKKHFVLPILALTLLAPVMAQPASPFIGRWDLYVVNQRGRTPDWLEVTQSGGALAARYQPGGGASQPIQGVRLDGSHLILTVTRAATWDLTVSGDKISGAQKTGENETAKIEGVRAPALKRAAPAAWTAPEPLFNGKDLTGWEPTGANNKWAAENGELVNAERGANLKTTRKFDDFKLHIELQCTEDHCNSGIYLRGRYEIQVGTEGGTQPSHEQGAVYGMVAPAPALPLGIGQWQTFDITFVGRNVTVIQNGTKIHDNVEIPGITGGALDADEGQPGPIYLQGDHGPVKYRNITISVPR